MGSRKRARPTDPRGRLAMSAMHAGLQALQLDDGRQELSCTLSMRPQSLLLCTGSTPNGRTPAADIFRQAIAVVRGRDTHAFHFQSSEWFLPLANGSLAFAVFRSFNFRRHEEDHVNADFGHQSLSKCAKCESVFSASQNSND